MTLDPRTIEFKDIPSLLRAALDLLNRRIACFVILSAVSVMAYEFIRDQSYLLIIFVAPYIFNIGVLIAKCADDNRPIIPALLSIRPSLFLKTGIPAFALILLNVLVLVFIVFVLFIVSYYFGYDAFKTEDGASENETYFLDGYLVACVFAFLSNTVIFIGAPILIIYYGVGIKQLLQISYKAFYKNYNVFTAILFFAALTTFIEYPLSLVSFFLLPYFCCFSYVLFRAVFLGKIENTKTKSNTAMAPAPSQA